MCYTSENMTTTANAAVDISGETIGTSRKQTEQRDLHFMYQFAGAQVQNFGDNDDDAITPPDSHAETLSLEVENQFGAFLMESPEKPESDPLEWWRKNHQRYDSLVPGVKNIFVLPQLVLLPSQFSVLLVIL